MSDESPLTPRETAALEADIFSLYKAEDYFKLVADRGHLPEHLVLVLPMEPKLGDIPSEEDIDFPCCACFAHDGRKHCGEYVGRDCYGIFNCPVAAFPLD